MNKKPVIIDMDGDLDNLIALSYAITSPSIEVLGVTTTHGFYSVHWAAAQVKDFLLATGWDVPVVKGAESPMMRTRMKKALQDPASVDTSAGAVAAWDWMYQQLEASQVPVTVCLMGTATNLSMLLNKYPDAAERIERIVFAGGSFSFGTITACACHKVYFDAEAMQYVMHAGVPFTMMAVDVTSGFVKGTKLEQLLEGWTGSLWRRVRSGCGLCNKANSVLRTPMAMVLLTHPELFTKDAYKCEVELHGTYTYGMTVVYKNNFDGIKVHEDGTKERMDVREEDKNICYIHEFDVNSVMELITQQVSVLEEVSK